VGKPPSSESKSNHRGLFVSLNSSPECSSFVLFISCNSEFSPECSSFASCNNSSPECRSFASCNSSSECSSFVSCSNSSPECCSFASCNSSSECSSFVSFSNSSPECGAGNTSSSVDRTVENALSSSSKITSAHYIALFCWKSHSFQILPVYPSTIQRFEHAPNLPSLRCSSAILL